MNFHTLLVQLQTTLAMSVILVIPKLFVNKVESGLMCQPVQVITMLFSANS